MTTSIIPLSSYRSEAGYPFCPGCGHGSILDKLNDALIELGRPPERIVLVSDIGCSGLSDQFFVTNAFHGLHGRSITYATGIKLANPDLTVVVLMGDGGVGIGGAHLIAAARRNVDITVLVMNNLNFGMTGGQYSTTTPRGAATATSPAGNLEHPLDICGTVGVNGAAYAHRATSFDRDLAERIVEAVRRPGFAVLDIWELCTAYYVRNNKFSRVGITHTMTDLGLSEGTVVDRMVTDYTTAYRAAHAAAESPPAPTGLTATFPTAVTEPRSIVVAGSAGGKVRSAASTIGEAAIRSGLWVTQRDDYPVTVKSGHSVSMMTLAPTEQPISAVAAPDCLVILTDDGLAKADRYLAAMRPGQLVVTVLPQAGIETDADVALLDLQTGPHGISKTGLALAGLTATMLRLGWIEPEAIAASIHDGPFAGAALAAFEAGRDAGWR